MKTFVAIEDYNVHVDLGVKYSKEVIIAIWYHHLGHALYCPCAARLLGEQDQQAPHHPLQGDWVLWLCAGALIPAPRESGILSAPVPKTC